MDILDDAESPDDVDMFIEQIQATMDKFPGAIDGIAIKDSDFAEVMIENEKSHLLKPCLEEICKLADQYGFNLGMDIDDGVTPEEAVSKFGDFGFEYSGDMRLFRDALLPEHQPSMAPH